ncbi:MAG: hypothetical protein GY822_01615 [Deltaproteobacteria bacterium]|nr:hypothetical protein [Deltaproteobacteria bacterium]
MLIPLFSLAFFAPVASAQSALKSGVRGRVVVAKEFLEKKEWPVEGARAKSSLGVSRVRRPAGHGPLNVALEPAPELLVVLEGIKDEIPSEKEIVFEGLRFSPGTVLVTGTTSLKVTNRHTTAIRLRDEKNIDLGTVAAGETKNIELANGKILISSKEFPFALAEVTVVEKAKVLQLRAKDGFFDDVPLVPGDYRLAFYHGAIPFIVQEITVPKREYIAIDATISGNRVATVSIKDGGLKAMATSEQGWNGGTARTKEEIEPRPTPKRRPPPPTPKREPKIARDGVEEVDPGDIE